MLGVNAWDEPEDVVAGFVQEKSLKHRILLYGRDVAAQCGFTGLPGILWIDREGLIVDASVGLTSGRRINAKTKALLQLGK